MPQVFVNGLVHNGPAEIISVQFYGPDMVEVSYKDPEGGLHQEFLYRDDESRLELVQMGQPWSFSADGAAFRLVAEAQRIKYAHLFDPHLAVNTSNVTPLPHQITAVYEAMLPKQPLRFLLADDPGAGKTIMAGLLIKELIVRGDLKRCLIVCPGSLVEQWQDELRLKFQLPFQIMTNDLLANTQGGNYFLENDLVIARLDKMSRDERVQELIQAPDCYYDLIVCDEAHKMSASFFGGEVNYTLRYQLGRLLSSLTRHFLLMTATPHNGKEEDFQLFLALLDGDRFEGRFRDGVHQVDTSDLIRRMVKENLLTFEGKPLFPERLAHTVPYKLSDDEAKLYAAVTNYVREEFNRADQLDNKRKGTVGFALTILQRRLASSPEAIFRSLERRIKKLEIRLKEVQIMRRGSVILSEGPIYSTYNVEDMDDYPADEMEEMEEEILDQATAARTIDELLAEIDTLRNLCDLANHVRQSGQDTKWVELSELLNEVYSPVRDAKGTAPTGMQLIIKEYPSIPSPNQKLVIFTEHRDTLEYLLRKTRNLIGDENAVVTIHGGIGREDRNKAKESFLFDPTVRVLIATDAAGEGYNLQRAHLMVNYDLPWNPNRLEQRFGRIHRIGQKEVCHLWNLIAVETREGAVYKRLLDKLEQARESLHGQVFDVLGQLEFDGKPLRELLLEAIRYGERPEVRARLDQSVDTGMDRERLKNLINNQALAQDVMDFSKVLKVKEAMERAEARRLQPHFIQSFFQEAFTQLGGVIRNREPGRFEIRNVPVSIRNRDRQIGIGSPILVRYERVTFHRDQIQPDGKPLADMICPGHPLLDVVVDLTLERDRNLLKEGVILIDEHDEGTEPRLLFFLEHSIQDQRTTSTGQTRTISRKFLFIERNASGQMYQKHYAPYLDYRPLEEGDPEPQEILAREELSWLSKDLEREAVGFAAQHIVQEHRDEVMTARKESISKIRQAVQDRLTKEITYWDHRAEMLRHEEAAGKINARMNSENARRRADELQGRLRVRMEELSAEEKIVARPPILKGVALVLPKHFLYQAKQIEMQVIIAADRQAIAAKARDVIMEKERGLGFEPKDVEQLKLGYDIESRDPRTGRLRFIEVKGRTADAKTITVTKNEILYSKNNQEDYILAIVLFSDLNVYTMHYIPNPFDEEPGFAVASINYELSKLLESAQNPGK